MTRGWLSVAVVVACASAALAQSTASKTAADREFDQRARSELAKVSEQAAAAFDAGNAARDAGRFDDASAAYRRVIAAAPSLDHGHRRLCATLSATGHHDDAIAECRKALALGPAVLADKAALAAAIAQREAPGDVEEATRLAREAANDPQAGFNEIETWCQLVWRSRQETELVACSERLLGADPDGWLANYLGTMAAELRDDFDLARRRLEKAHAAGLSDAEYLELRKLLAEDEESRGRDRGPRATDGIRLPASFLWLVLWVFAAWLGGALLLAGTGYALSRAQLRALVDPAAAARPGARERFLRRTYRAALALTGVYFYLSLPLLETTVGGAGAAVFAVVTGTVPIMLLAVIGLLLLGAIGMVVRTLTVRVRVVPLGERLVLADHPKLRQLLAEVATSVGTQPADAVYLTRDAEMGVTEHPGMWGALRRKRATRVLVMGIRLFDGMTQLQLRSVLAHEHGHFRNADTAGGGFALQVRQSLRAVIAQLLHEGRADWVNPAWWFVRGYLRVFLVMSQGASRLQEVLADRWSVHAYGTQAFVASYRHIVSRTVEAAAAPGADIAAKIEEELARDPHPYDSHPSAKQRIAWAETMAVAREPQPTDDAPVWELVSDRAGIEARLAA